MIIAQRAAYSFLRNKQTKQSSCFLHHNVRWSSTSANNNNKKPTTSHSLIWKVATFATVGTTFAVVANYLNDSSWRYEETTTTGPVPPLATVTTQTYFDVAIDNQPAGRIVIGLYGDVVPTTVAHFENYCHKGYAGTLFHRVIPGFMIQGGQIVPTTHNMTFDDENFVLEHVGPGVVSMANAGRNTNTTQFFITTARTAHLNGKHVVFGSVLAGYEVVKAIEACGTSSGVPSKVVKITAAGILPVET